MLSFSWLFSDHLIDFVQELVNVLELAIYGGEPDVGDLIKSMQVLHNQLTDFLRAYLLFIGLLERCLDRIHQLL